MILDARKQFERLQAVNAEFFEKVVIGSESAGGEFEMPLGKGQDFLSGVSQSWHD
jgi:hypothetical protein